MKVWVIKCKFLAFLALVSSSLGVSGEERTTTCDDVQGQLKELKNSVNMAVEKLEKKVDDVASYSIRNKVLTLEKEVERLKVETQKILPLTERVQQLEGEIQKTQAITEDVQKLETNDQKIIERMDEVTGNISAITEELQGLKAEDQEILQDQRDLKAKLRILWKTSFVKEMVTTPKARLYSGANFTGDFEDYTYKTAEFKGGCHTLGKLRNNVTSVDTFGKCVRLFHGWSCKGRSVAVYPGSGNAENVLNPNMTEVWSIGPCLAEEFEDFDFKDGTKQMIVKNSSNPRKYFPDSVQFYDIEKRDMAMSPSGSSFSLDKYLLGRGNRLEFLRAFIYPWHLNISQPEFEMQNTSDFRSFDKEPGDIVGYGILPSFGGPLNETYNVFPQTISGKSKWTELTSEIRSFLEGGGPQVVLYLNFAYEDEAKSRPTGFYFWIGYDGGESWEKISYGRVEN